MALVVNIGVAPMRKLYLIASLATCLMVVHPARTLAQGAGPYTPEQVYFLLHDAIREALGVTPEDPQQPFWVSLSTVGSVADAADKANINDLANFCPPPSPVLVAYTREPKLDMIYERLINGMISPKRTYSSSYKKAKAFLVQNGANSPEVEKYRQYERAYIVAWSNYVYATDAAGRQLARLATQTALDDWNSLGFRQEVDQALNITAAEEFRAGDIRQRRRRNVLQAYRDLGFTGSNDVIGAFKSPASGLSPEIAKWGEQDGWVKISYSAASRMERYSQQNSSRSGFAGFSLGFITIGATGGGGNVSESRVKEVNNFAYDFEVKRVSIKRPWLDTTLFFEPFDWTWKRLANTTVFPRVAVPRSETGRPVQSPAPTYDNKTIACSLLPVELVIARKRVVTATMSKSDYQRVEESSNVSGAVGLFGIFGGAGGGSWHSTKVSEDANTVTFIIESPGTAIIGLISQFMPFAPQPNRTENWPADAWIPPADP
jgi:hypothetical protein